MSRSVLSAAAALNEFTAAQVAAYCEDDQDSVIQVLRDHDDLFEPVPHASTPRWRVTDRTRLREVIAAAESRGRPAGADHRPVPDGWREARLLLAEQTLILIFNLCGVGGGWSISSASSSVGLLSCWS
jgi:hypothetical protein